MDTKKTVSDYLHEVSKAYDDLGDMNTNLKLNLINFAVQMYNTENMNKNIGANMTIIEQK